MVFKFRKDGKIKTIVLTTFFIVIFNFFLFIRPFVPFDGDDWLNLGNFRSSLLPIWGGFNPSKVLPEILQPMVGVLAGVITPLTHNFINSIIFICAFLISLSFIFVISELWEFLITHFNISPYGLSVVIALYVISQFLILKTGTTNNGFLLLPVDFTCLFHYVIPGLLCQYLTLFFLNNGSLLSIYRKSIKRCSIVLSLLYFAIFSNILINIMVPLIMIYILIIYRNEIGKWKVMELSIIGIWVVSLIFEMSGVKSKMLV